MTKSPQDCTQKVAEQKFELITPQLENRVRMAYQYD